MSFWNVLCLNHHQRVWFAIVLGCMTAAVASAASFALPLPKSSPVFVFFMTAIMASTWGCGRVSGLVTSALATIINVHHIRAALFFAPALVRHELYLRLSAFAVTSCLTLELVARLKSASQRACSELRQRMALQEMLKKAEHQQLQVSKLHTLGRSAVGVAHDFNNLLMVIAGYIELLLADLPPACPAREHAAKVKAATCSASLITRQLLTLSEMRPRQGEVVEVNNVILQLRQLIPPLLGDRIEFRVTPCAQPTPIASSAGRIQQLILNLAFNSRHAMPQGGILHVETAIVDRHPSRCGSAPRRFLLLRVRDTGIGMDNVTRTHLFEPFFTTREAGKGTGLGLAIVKQIVEESEGFIDVHSSPGAGTTFEIAFPLASLGEADFKTSGENDRSKLSTVGATIMLVEDAAPLRELAREFLLTQGYRVLDAALGSEALELATQYNGIIDVLVTDLMMPGLDGFQIAERMRASRPALKVIYASGSIPELLMKQKSAGTAILEKPYTLQSLERVLFELLESPGLAMSA